MYNNYPGRNLYDDINKVVDKAFYKIYRYSENNWVEIDEIKLDYSVCEKDDPPIIIVTIRFSSTFDGNQSTEFNYYINESAQFNVGIVYSAIEKVLND